MAIIRGLQFVPVNATADGANTVVPAVTGGRIRVVSYLLMVTQPANPLLIQDDDGTLRAKFVFAANGGASFAGTDEGPAWEHGAGKALQIVNPVGVDTFGHLCLVMGV